MKEIRVRQGVVLIEIKGAYMLVSDKKARKCCRYVRRVNGTAAFLWKMIEKGSSFEEIVNGFMERYEIHDPEMLKQDISRCVSKLEEKGYLCTYETGGSQVD